MIRGMPITVNITATLHMTGNQLLMFFEFRLVLFFERIEPSQKSTVLSRTPGTTGNNVWMTDVEDFKLVGDYMFVIKSASKVRRYLCVLIISKI